MRAVVCIPYRSDGAERERNFRYVLDWWRRFEWDIYLGDDVSHDPFSAGRSRNLAALEAGDWDVAVFSDADMVPDTGGQVGEAIQTAYTTGSYATIHSEIRYTSEHLAWEVCAGQAELTREATPDGTGGVWIPSFAIRRDLWDAIGGYDNRLHGCSGEDLAIYFAANMLGGSVRTEGRLYHLWHPPIPAEERWGNEIWSVVNAYSRAREDKAMMLEVLADQRANDPGL